MHFFSNHVGMGSNEHDLVGESLISRMTSSMDKGENSVSVWGHCCSTRATTRHTFPISEAGLFHRAAIKQLIDDSDL